MFQADVLIVCLMAKQSDKEGTKGRILDAAQSLFAQRGFDAVSLRDITAAAGVNVAAVNYHFGSKEGLIEALLMRRMMPVMLERMRLLDAAEEEFGGGVIPVERVLDAFMRPFLTGLQGNGEERQLFSKFMGRCMADRGSDLPEKALEVLQRVLERFTHELGRVLRDLSEEELIWRLHYCFGVMVHTLMHGERLSVYSQGRSGEPDFETTLQRMIDFCRGGLEA